MTVRGHPHSLGRPDVDAMIAHLEALFGQATTGLIEIAWNDPTPDPKTGRHNLSRARLFDVGELIEAGEFAAETNAVQRQNVYVGAALRAMDTPRDRRASKAAFLAAPALWADFDDDGAFDTAVTRAGDLGVPPTFALITGETPHTRGQMFWALEEPLRHGDAVETALKRLKTYLGGDAAVVDRARVMRLAGGVAWPLKEGRVLEQVTAALTARQAPYAHGAIDRALDVKRDRETTGAVFDFDFNTADRFDDGRTADGRVDVDTLCHDAMRREGSWHSNVLRVIGRLVLDGWTNDQISTLAAFLTRYDLGYTVAQTRAELAPMVDGARRNLSQPDPGPNAPPPPAPDPRRAPRTPITLAEAVKREPPPQILEGYLTENAFSMLVAPPKAGKTFVALDIWLSIAAGQPWHGQAVEQAPVGYVVAEGQGGFALRAQAWCEARNGGDLDVPFYLWEWPTPLTDEASRTELGAAMHGLGVKHLVIDTLARNFGPGNENQQQDMNAFVAACDELRVGLGGHVQVVHHTGKNGEEERGSTVLRGAVDQGLVLTRPAAGRVLVDAPVMKDLAPPDTRAFRLTPVETAHQVTGEVYSTCVLTLEEDPVADALDAATGGASGDAKTSPRRPSKAQLAILHALRTHGDMRAGAIAKAIKSNISNVRRTLTALIEKQQVVIVRHYENQSDHQSDHLGPLYGLNAPFADRGNDHHDHI